MIFSVVRGRNLCVRVNMRLVDFFRVLMIFHEYIMVCGLTFYGFQDDVCHCLWVSCHIERDFMDLAPSTTFSVLEKEFFPYGFSCVWLTILGFVGYF